MTIDLSLRDYLAGEALIGLLMKTAGRLITNDAIFAERAYEIADAMLAARSSVAVHESDTRQPEPYPLCVCGGTYGDHFASREATPGGCFAPPNHAPKTKEDYTGQFCPCVQYEAAGAATPQVRLPED